MSEELEFCDLLSCLNSANYHASSIDEEGMDEISEEIQKLIEKVKKIRKKVFY